MDYLGMSHRLLLELYIVTARRLRPSSTQCPRPSCRVTLQVPDLHQSPLRLCAQRVKTNGTIFIELHRQRPVNPVKDRGESGGCDTQSSCNQACSKQVGRGMRSFSYHSSSQDAGHEYRKQ